MYHYFCICNHARKLFYAVISAISGVLSLGRYIADMSKDFNGSKLGPVSHRDYVIS